MKRLRRSRRGTRSMPRECESWAARITKRRAARDCQTAAMATTPTQSVSFLVRIASRRSRSVGLRPFDIIGCRTTEIRGSSSNDQLRRGNNLSAAQRLTRRDLVQIKAIKRKAAASGSQLATLIPRTARCDAAYPWSVMVCGGWPRCFIALLQNAFAAATSRFALEHEVNRVPGSINRSIQVDPLATDFM